MDGAELLEAMLDKGKEYARTKARLAALERMRKQAKALAKTKLLAAGKTLGAAEEMALLEDEYIKACEIEEEAAEEHFHAAVEKELADARFEYWRSVQANRRAQSNFR